MNIELRHLRYFVAVAEELHFGRAAARLNISQPPLSQQIQALEQQIGARLLARTNRSVLLTAAGKQFLADSRQILSMVDDAAACLNRSSRGRSARPSLSVPTAMAPELTKIISCPISCKSDSVRARISILRKFGAQDGCVIVDVPTFTTTRCFLNSTILSRLFPNFEVL